MQVEIFKLRDAQRVVLAIAYGIISIAAGYTGVWLTTGLVRRSRVI